MLDTSSATVTNVVERLVERGYLTRVQHPTDRRAHYLVPTEEAVRRVDEAYQSHHSALVGVIETLSPEQAEAAATSSRTSPTRSTVSRRRTPRRTRRWSAEGAESALEVAAQRLDGGVVIDDVGFARHRDRPRDDAGDEDRDRPAVGAHRIVVDIVALLERGAGGLVATPDEQRRLAELLGDERLAAQPRIVAGTGAAELRDEDDVAGRP